MIFGKPNQIIQVGVALLWLCLTASCNPHQTSSTRLLCGLHAHTWMFFPEGWARHGDWPDLAASRAPSPLMVQYNRDDHLFTPKGMRAAHERIASLYARADRPDAYEGTSMTGRTCSTRACSWTPSPDC